MRFLPSDLFRTCLARVLMVLFDILVSHFHMVRWHEAALERHAAEAASLAAARRDLASRLAGSGVDSSVAGAAAGAGEESDSGANPDSSGADLLPPLGSPGGEAVTVTGRAVMGLQLQRGTASELEELEARSSDEEEWGVVLKVGGGLGHWFLCHVRSRQGGLRHSSADHNYGQAVGQGLNASSFHKAMARLLSDTRKLPQCLALSPVTWSVPTCRRCTLGC